MSIYKFRNSWRAEVYVSGKRIANCSGFKTKSEAKKWHSVTLSKETELSLVKNHDIKFEKLVEIFEKRHLTTVKQGTATRYIIDIKYRILPYFQFYSVFDITQAMVEDFKIENLTKLSAKSVNNCLSLLKIIFKKAVEWEFIKSNPADNVFLQKLSQQKYQWWEDENDIKKFMAVARYSRHYLAYRLALDFGLRLGEIIGLSKGDINFNQCSIHVHRQWLDKENRFGSTKHGKERILYFSQNDEIYNLLKRAVEYDKNIDVLVLNSTGKRESARKLSGYFFQKIIAKSGVPRIRFHDLRHTFASWFMIKHDNVWKLKEILGHADVQTTQRYAHLSRKNRAVFAPVC